MKKLFVAILFVGLVVSNAYADWGGSIGVSHVGVEGNYDNSLYDGTANELVAISASASRTTDYHEVVLSGKVLYDMYDNTVIAEWYDFNDKHTVVNKINESGFTWASHITWNRNDITNIEDVEVTINGGYQLVIEGVTISGYAGVGAIYEEFDDETALAEEVARFSGDCTIDLGAVDLVLNVEHIYPIDNEDDYRTDYGGQLSFGLNDYVSLQVGVNGEYVNEPYVGERNDLFTDIGIIVNF